MTVRYSHAENCTMGRPTEVPSFDCLDARNRSAECILSEPLLVDRTWPYVSVQHTFKRRYTGYNLLEVRLVSDDATYHLVSPERRPSIGLPPLHAHHVHIDGHWFETHGDYYWPSRNYSRKLPHNVCAIAPSLELQPLGDMYATINLVAGDVATVAFRILVLMSPCDRGATEVTKFDYALFSNDLGSCWNRYRIPTNTSTYTIWHGRHSIDASMVSPRQMLPWVHAHRANFRGLFMYDDHVRNLSAFSSCVANTAWARTCVCPPRGECNDVRSLLSDARLVCYILNDAEGDSARMQCRDRGWTFRRHEAYTMVVLSRATPGSARDGIMDQHSHFFFYGLVHDPVAVHPAFSRAFGYVDDGFFVEQSARVIPMRAMTPRSRA